MRTLYIHGQVFTGALPLAQAFAVCDGRFAAVGSTDEILAQKQENDIIIDLQGRFVCPGFIDSHMHLLGLGSNLESCALAQHTASLYDMQEALRAYIASRTWEPGSWIRGRGFNHDYFAEKSGLPTRHDLDAVTTDYPVCVVRCCGHCLCVNTKALELLGIDGTQEQAPGGHYDVDETGYPTGVFRDNAMSMIYTRLPKPTRADIRRMLRAACLQLNRVGVTSVHTDDLCTFENVDYEDVLSAYRELRDAGELSVRVYEQSQFVSVPALRGFLEKGYITGAGDALFKIGPLKLLGDGSLGARTAFLSGGYADAPDERGLSLFTQEEFDALIGCAHENGMQIAVHAIGDGVLDRILNAYEKAFAAHPRADHRSGVVHVQITRPDQLERMRNLNLHAYVQTIFIDYDARIVRDRVGDALADTSYAFRTMKEMGMHVSNGTDCPVEAPDPMRGVQCAVTRQPLDESLAPYRQEEAFTLEEALRAYTLEGAYASFEEREKGQIAPGMLADFVVLSGNPFACEHAQLHKITALETYLGGRAVYACT